MGSKAKRCITLALFAVASCGGDREAGAEPEAVREASPGARAPVPPDPEPPPLPPDEFRDCTRGRQAGGVLADLPGYRFERTAGYGEIEYAELSVGPVRIEYSGCHQFTREYAFELGERLGPVADADVYRRAAALMQVLGDEADNRGARSVAREIEERSASGDFAIGEDLTGEMFEGDYGLGVRLEEGESGGSVLVVIQNFKL